MESFKGVQDHANSLAIELVWVTVNLESILKKKTLENFVAEDKVSMDVQEVANYSLEGALEEVT